MIVGLGLDVTEVGRIRIAVERYGRRFLGRIFTGREIAYAESKSNRYERYAARFAAKEAGLKALGTGWVDGIRWQDLEVVNAAGGAPEIELHGRAAELAKEKGSARALLTLTHTATVAAAVVILESEPR
ncbi:MAG TPA: holo-[acyl-carrier-protein] synthase [Solibacterales bacterium]|nr:holo-[acyl-carrier-protein] synthase [Bryobacterales bacterium]